MGELDLTLKWNLTFEINQTSLTDYLLPCLWQFDNEINFICLRIISFYLENKLKCLQITWNSSGVEISMLSVKPWLFLCVKKVSQVWLWWRFIRMIAGYHDFEDFNDMTWFVTSSTNKHSSLLYKSRTESFLPYLGWNNSRLKDSWRLHYTKLFA